MHNLFSIILNSIIIILLWFACWKVLEVSLLLVVVLSNSKLLCWGETSTHCDIGICSTSCSIVSYIFYELIRIYSCRNNETRGLTKKLNKIYMLLIWNGNITGLLIPLTNPLRFHKRILHICKDAWENIYFVYVANDLMCVVIKYLVFMTKSPIILRNITILDVTPSLTPWNTKERMFLVWVSLLVVTISSHAYNVFLH